MKKGKGMEGEGKRKAREKRREKETKREENRKGRKNGRVGKEIKLVATLYTPAPI